MTEKFEQPSAHESNPRETVPFELLRSWNSDHYPIETYGEACSLVVLGESHHAIEAQANQVELMRLVRPEYVLHEYLTGRIYDPKSKEFRKQPNRRFTLSELDKREGIKADKIIMEAADELGFTVVGCDITEAEVTVVEKKIAREHPDEYRYNYKVERLENIADPDKDYSIHSPVIIPYRDRQMVETMLHYLGETTKPVIAIVGAEHGENIHSRKLLQGKGFGYAFIDQSL